MIEEYKIVSNEIDKLNLMLRQSAGVMTLSVSTGRIIILLKVIYFNGNFFVSLLLLVEFCLLFFFGFGLTYLFSRQIKSAHQSYKLIYSILSRSKMRLQFKLKVANFLRYSF